jgi:hypothetical protein
MSRRGFRDRVILKGVGEEGALAGQAAEPSGELPRPAVEIVGAHLIDREEDHELRSSGARRSLRRRHISEERSGDHASEKGSGSQEPALRHRSLFLSVVREAESSSLLRRVFREI